MTSDVTLPTKTAAWSRSAIFLSLLLAWFSTLVPQSARAVTPPVITTEPVASTNLTATEVIFLVVATGTEPLRYQWYFNITNRLAGETNASLIYTNIGAFQEGYFSVAVTNIAGGVTSSPVFLTVLIPPLVTREPTNVVTAVGGSASFSVTATGDEPLRYQWYFNIIDEIVGATNATLTLTNLQKTNSGTYQIEVSNDYDTVNSVEALLTVKDPPVITANPVSVSVPPGTAASFTVEVTGDGPFSYQWYFNRTNAIFAGTTASLAVANPQLASAGEYTVTIATDVGTVTSQPAVLTVLQAPSITTQPVSATSIIGSNVTLSVTAIGASPLTYQWYLNRTNPIAGGTQPTLALSNLQVTNAGIYSVVISNPSGSVTSINASVTVFVQPQITAGPNNLTIRSGQTAIFTVTASGTAPLTYRWFFNATNLIAGANSSSLSIPGVQLANAGTYSVSVSNLAGVASSTATLTVQSPPVIVQQPVTRAVLPGGSATFSVQAVGDSPLAYQWYFNTTNAIVGATSPDYVISNAQAANAGRYSVRITNSLGAILSAEANLAVKLPPNIVQQPVSLTVTQGNTASFVVSVSGDGPFSYRWLLNGTNAVPGTNGSTLLLPNAQNSIAGNYSVVVTNEVGSAASTDALLTVRTPPNITQQPASVFAAPGGNATFNVSALGDQPLTYQWYFNGTNAITAATNNSLNVSGVTVAADGLYSVTISNEIGTATSVGASLQVRLPPVVSLPPASISVTQGHTAIFSVEVSGDGPFAYQWFFNSASPISGANSSSLTLLNVLPSAAGQYSVQITNVVGSVFSPTATLTVRPLPVITQQPASLVVTQGQTATFSVNATSETPLTYQWRRNGIALAATTSSFTITGALPSNAGIYDVIVANSYGSVTSAVASLTVYGFDFGDAPASNYPTSQANNGAHHVIVPGVFLGLLIDADSDGQSSPTATGDDSTGVDDEDGIRFITPLRLGQPANIEVIASTNGFLSAWLDLDITDGWSQPIEQILTDTPLQAGTNILTTLIPADYLATGSTFARFRFSSSSGLSPADFAPDGEVEDYAVTIEPAADLQLTQSFSSPEVTMGSSAVLTVTANNVGPSTATAVTLTNRLSPRSTFISATSSQGSCAHFNGIVVCELGNLNVGSGVTINITTMIGQGTNVAVTTVHANEFDPSRENQSGASSIVGTSATPQFANSDIIIMPLPDAGAATPYPAGIIVTGVTTAVHQVRVTLRGLNHDYPDDIDILLVGPQGQTVVLMSDAGFDNPIFDATITFDDILGLPIPDSNPAITTGSYIPFNHSPVNDFFPAPAPEGPYTADLSSFRGTDPNGIWSLYVIDDSLDNGGSDVPGFISDGWTLNIVTADPLADLGIAATASPAEVSIGQPITYSLTITNHGPAPSAATIRSAFPSALSFVTASTPQGACSHSSGVVTCDLGNIATGASVTFTITATASIGGNITNVFAVTGSQLDLNSANNSAAAVQVVRPMVNLAITVLAPPSPTLLKQETLLLVALTNYGPNTATGVWLTNLLPVNATFLSFSASQGSCSALGQTVVCTLGEVPVGTSPLVGIHFAPGDTGVSSNFLHITAAEEESSPANNKSSSLFTVVPATDLAISASAVTSSVPLNRDFVITLNVTNRGPITANATVTDTLPAGTTFTSAVTPRGNCSHDGPLVHCDFLNLAPGEGSTIILRAQANVLGSISNVATVSGSLPDYNLLNNNMTNLATVTLSAGLAIAIADRPDPVWQGENLLYSLAVTNQGPSVATNVVVTNLLPAGLTFVSATTSQGSCTRSGDLVRCNLGTLAAGASSTVNITTRPPLSGLITNTANVSSPVVDSELSDNAASSVTQVLSGAAVVSSATSITTPLLGLANPYPSSVTVSGLTSAVFQVRVTLLNLSHSFSDDLDMLLVGPDGRATLLMSDCGGEFSLSSVTLTIDDNATNMLGDSTAISSGIVRPANYGADIDTFAAPAPTGPYATNLSIYNGTDPNGTWSLYVMDDADKDSGSMAGGWRLTISAIEPMADLGLAQSVSRNPAAAGSNGVFSYTVTNRGPSAASNVRITNSLPGTLNVTAFTNAHGFCAISGNNLICDLGTIAPGTSASLTVAATSMVPGTLTNFATVGFDGVDLRPTNNVSTLAVTFELPPIITLQPITQTTTVGSSVQFIATATGAAPLAYQWQRDGSDLPGATNPSLTLNNISLNNAGSYRLRVSNAVGSALSDAALLLIPGPPTISAIPNLTIDEDTDIGAVPFSVQDFDTPVATLTLNATSSDPVLVPTSGITFAGTGQNRTIRVSPAANRSGTATIAVRVLDTTGASATNTFSLTVRPVNDPIIIVAQPRNFLSLTGSTVNFSITATSSLPLNYQWQRNGLSLAGATSATFTIVNVSTTNEGSYRVIVTNADTNITSATVSLQTTNQLPKPNIVSITQSGSTATITFTTVLGLIYTLEYKGNLADETWTALGTISGIGDTEILTDSSATIPTRYYRIRAN